MQAIVDGEPPDLPAEGYSDAARSFVRSCLHKIPARRPTYAMLMKHPWLKPLVATSSAIMEEEEEEEEVEKQEAISTESPAETKNPALPDDVVDAEVAEWVIQALEKKRLGKLSKSEKPALHAAPLDAIPATLTPENGVPTLDDQAAVTESKAMEGNGAAVEPEVAV